MYRITFHCTCLLIFLSCSLCLTAQEIMGKVTGNNGAPLPGASISIAGSPVSATSDLSGFFNLLNASQGKVALRISYIGYSDYSGEFTIRKGINNIGTISLSAAPTALGAVIVSGPTAASQAKAVSIKKASLGIMEVLAADAIGKLPDRNAAEAIQRLQGVSIARDAGEGRYVTVRGVPTQWTASLLNGNHMPSASVDYTDRRIQMDIFPSELIEYVQLSKAITPDIEGDNIGGSVNFITRAAPVKRTLTINAAGGYNTLTQSGSYNGSIVYGDRLPGGKLGYIVSAVIWDRGAAVNRYNIDYNFSLPDHTQSFSMADLQLRDYHLRRRTTGYNGGLEYVFNPRHKIYWKGMYSQYNDDQTVREEYFNFNAPASMVQQTRHGLYKTRLYGLELGGVSTLSSRWKLDWAAGVDGSNAQVTNPATGAVGYPIVNFTQKMKYNGLSSDGRMYLKMDSPDGIGDGIDHVQPHNASPINADSLKLNMVIVARIHNKETNQRGGFNLQYAVNPAFNIKFGGKFQHKDKSVDNSPVDVYMAGILGPAPALSAFPREPYPFHGGFLRPIGSPYNNVIINHIATGEIPTLASPAGIAQYKLYVAERDSAGNVSGATKYYSGTEDVYAGYVMADYKLNKSVTLIGGVRNEYNDADYKSSLVLTQVNPNNGQRTNTISPVDRHYSYNALLPMLHVKYQPDNNDVVRLAYTRTFIRPDFGSLNPATTQSDLNHTITQGNPDLKPTFSDNFDWMAEHYFGGVGLINAGAFYKHLHDFIYSNGGTQDINGVAYLVSQPENLPTAWLYGFEAGISKRFLKLPGFWKGFGIEANYTFVNSQTRIPRLISAAGTPDKYTTDVTSLPQQSKHIFNAVVLYEKSGFMARIAGNYKGESIFTINAAYGTDHYVWTASNFTVDFSSSYAISKRFRVFLELNNITNAPTRYFMGTYNRVYQAEWYGLRGQVGINARFF